MLRLLALGILSALFFSSTFILNRAMSLAGGHWVWTASLRYGYMGLFLCLWLILTGKARLLREVSAIFRQHWRFWIMSGSIGFGLFYAAITFSAAYAAGWVVAATWQITLLATPVVLWFLGRRVPTKGILFSLLIFIGIVLVNVEHATKTSWHDVLLGGLPVLVAAFAYPFGNQMVWEARQGGHAWLPHIDHPALENTVVRVLLMTLGSLPVWLILLLVTQPPPPPNEQLLNTALVALCSGLIATSIFLYARHLAVNAYELAAVDATQSTEVLFSLLGEILLLHGAWPGALGLAGIGLTVLGLVLYLLAQTKDRTPVLD
ncbi:MAG: multidrug resistance efflux transporter family protein [Chloroflexi bacterium]|nr:multidrug resistance efflux transporter family protein [Chloroflexota bacterium]